MTDRQVLAEQQAALVRSLLLGAEVPPGFDPGAVAAQAELLHAKRRRSMERLVPDLLDLLADRFAQWAAANPPRVGHCADEDAREFRSWLESGRRGAGSRWRRRRPADR